MKLEIRVGKMTLFSTDVTPTAHVTITFSGSRWFGWSLAVAFQDIKTATAAVFTGK